MQEPTQDVFELVLVRGVQTPAGEHEHLAHLWWLAPRQGDRRVQVYVDGELVEATAHREQRDLWLMLDRSRPHRVELLAVSPEADVWQPHPQHLQAWRPTVQSRASLALLRDEALPVDATVEMSVDGQARPAAALWPGDEHRSGFGGLFGEGGFGLGAATGPGLGLGELGYGPLGSDGTAFRWRDEGLLPGPLMLDVAVRDGQGRHVAGPTSVELDVQGLPAAVEPALDENWTLNWSV